jgi:hypothetical protein
LDSTLTDSTRRNLPFIGYALLAAGFAVTILLVQSYARDTREAVRETHRLTIVVAGQTEEINAARRESCETNNDRWNKLGDVLRPFRNNPMQTPAQRKTIEDLLRVTEPRDCAVLPLKGAP